MAEVFGIGRGVKNFGRAADAEPGVFGKPDVRGIFSTDFGEKVEQIFLKQFQAEHCFLLRTGKDFFFDGVGKTDGGVGNADRFGVFGHLRQFLGEDISSLRSSPSLAGVKSFCLRTIPALASPISRALAV